MAIPVSALIMTDARRRLVGKLVLYRFDFRAVLATKICEMAEGRRAGGSNRNFAIPSTTRPSQIIIDLSENRTKAYSPRDLLSYKGEGAAVTILGSQIYRWLHLHGHLPWGQSLRAAPRSPRHPAALAPRGDKPYIKAVQRARVHTELLCLDR